MFSKCLSINNRLLYHFKYNKCGHRNVLSKRQVWKSIFHIINLKKKIMDTGVLDSFSKNLILGYYFSPTPPPKGYIIVSLIINSDYLFKINRIYKTTDICSIFNADLSFSRKLFLFFSLNCRSITFI